MKTLLHGAMIGLVAVLALGCGGDDSAAVDGGGSDAAAAVDASSNLRYSCDHVNGGGARTGCSDTVYTAATTAIVNAAKAMCVPQGGTVGDTCDTTGAVGGCRNVNAGGAPGVTTTAWFYTGTVAQTMTRCTTMPGATFVTP